MIEFSHFNQVINRAMKLDSWIEGVGINGYFKALEKELVEAKEAYEKEDVDNLIDELGDVLICWLILTKLVGKKYGFSEKDSIKKAIDKSIRRRPYLMENRKVSKEESLKMWLDIKKLEKEGKI